MQARGGKNRADLRCCQVDAPVNNGEKGYLRPLELRAAAMRVRRFGAPLPSRTVDQGRAQEAARDDLATCMAASAWTGGWDMGRLVRLIERYDPDIVALQEVDVNRSRSGGVDQAKAVAREVSMDMHFHPVLQVAEEQYGDALLSRHPMRLVKAGSLPTPSQVEPRGVLWVEVDVDGSPIQVMNTHFGLGRSERIRQAQALLGDMWIGHPSCRGPLVVCGDFNSMPRSAVYRMVAARLKDARHGCSAGPGQLRGSFLGLWHLDYVFVNDAFEFRGDRRGVLDLGSGEFGSLTGRVWISNSKRRLESRQRKCCPWVWPWQPEPTAPSRNPRLKPKPRWLSSRARKVWGSIPSEPVALKEIGRNRPRRGGQGSA